MYRESGRPEWSVSKTPQRLCNPASGATPVDFQDESSKRQGTGAMENILSCTSAQSEVPEELNDYRPVALTSQIIKTLEHSSFSEIRGH